MTINLDKYFHIDEKKNATIFLGDKLEIFIPTRYINYGLLSHDKSLNALGIFEMKINDTITGGLCLPAKLSMIPKETYTTTIDEVSYMVATFQKHDTFIENMTVIKNDALGYVLWKEFISLGNLPKFITYDNIGTLFDLIAQVCGINFGVNHAVFEMIYAHLYRDPDDITKEYRLSKMNKPPVFIELRNVSYGPDTTTAKMLGSYWNDGINSSLVNASDKVSELDHTLFN